MIKAFFSYAKYNIVPILELLNVFKKDNMINDYKIIDNTNNSDDELLSDLSMIGDSIKDAKNGLGYQTSKSINIQDA